MEKYALKENEHLYLDFNAVNLRIKKAYAKEQMEQE
jgi:hypothetical protein